MKRTGSNNPGLAIALVCVVACAFLSVAAQRATAGPLTGPQTSVTMTIHGVDSTNPDNNATRNIDVAIDQETGAFSMSSGAGPGQPWDSALWNLDLITISGNADPQLNFGFTLTNMLNVVNEFTLTFNLPVSVSFPSTLTAGSVGITLTDGNSPTGAILSTVDSPTAFPIYQSRLDGIDHKSLFDSPYTLVEPVGGTVVDSSNFGFPGITEPGGPLTSDMEVEIRFTLTPQDLTAMTGNFVAIPLPASVWMGLCLLGATGVSRLMRRRRV